jgi:hypothetical protein
MKKPVPRTLSILALVLGVSTGLAIAQETPPPEVKAEVPPAEFESGFDTLLGRWMRPDGGYLITIQGVDPDGKLDAAYANPRPLPFAKAEAIQDGKTIKLFFELRAGGYNGSTYTLAYDPANDILQGVYYQAVAQQKFDVYFERAK